MKHVMLDIETLDTAPSAVVLSIGAVKFDADNIDPLGFHVVLDRHQQVKAARTISDSTVAWWMQQNDHARQVFSQKGTPVDEALNAFSRFISGTEYLWGNGSDFDNVVVKTLHHSFGRKEPWSHRANRCFRTFKALFPLAGDVDCGIESFVEHNALDDAKYQALYLQQAAKQHGIAL